MAKILFLLLIVFGFFWSWSHFRPQKRSKTTDESTKKPSLSHFQIVAYGVLALVIFAVFTGKAHWLMLMATAIIAFAKTGTSLLMRLLPFLGFAKRQGWLANPTFRTPYLLVQFDLQHHHYSGNIHDGPHAGTPIEQLDQHALGELESYYQTRDKKSFYLIQAIQHFAGFASGTQSKNDSKTYQESSTTGASSLEEAYLILGLPKDASVKDVRTAHKKLIQKLHPDRGGNDYLAARINEAKETLLKHLEKS